MYTCIYIYTHYMLHIVSYFDEYYSKCWILISAGSPKTKAVLSSRRDFKNALPRKKERGFTFVRMLIGDN